MTDQHARVNRVWGVIDRTTNNLLGEFPTREEADEFFNELLAADHRAGLHVEVVEAKGHATGSRAATGKHPGDERLGKIVEHIFGHINTSTADGRWLAREGRRLAQHAYDVGYDDGWAEGGTSDA